MESERHSFVPTPCVLSLWNFLLRLHLSSSRCPLRRRGWPASAGHTCERVSSDSGEKYGFGLEIVMTPALWSIAAAHNRFRRSRPEHTARPTLMDRYVRETPTLHDNLTVFCKHYILELVFYSLCIIWYYFELWASVDWFEALLALIYVVATIYGNDAVSAQWDRHHAGHVSFLLCRQRRAARVSLQVLVDKFNSDFYKGKFFLLWCNNAFQTYLLGDPSLRLTVVVCVHDWDTRLVLQQHAYGEQCWAIWKYV